MNSSNSTSAHLRNRLVLVLLLAGVAGCGGTTALSGDTGMDTFEDPLLDASPDTTADVIVDTGHEPDVPLPVDCPERIGPVDCDGLPPECPAGYFPEVQGGCWTGACLHCVDGCTGHDECVALKHCGCSYHEGCGWAQTIFRYAMETNDCVVPIDHPCASSCPGELPCPPPCSSDVTERCCGWCDPPDMTECVEGACIEILAHDCE